IERLQQSTGNASFNNMRAYSNAGEGGLDFVAHARSLGALASKVKGVAALASSLAVARKSDRTSVLVIETDPASSTAAGGHWWDVPVPEVSERAEVRAARERDGPGRGVDGGGGTPTHVFLGAGIPIS